MTRRGVGVTICSHSTQARTHAENQRVETLIIFCTLDTTFHGQKTFRLVRGLLSWSEPSHRDILRQGRVDKIVKSLIHAC